MRVAYFLHDLNDPAAARRIRMLHAGGAEVVATGFWRGERPCVEIDGAPTLPLAQSFDSRLGARAFETVKQAVLGRNLHTRIGPADLFLARNLEMLALATRQARGKIAVVYEALDIHRLLLGRGAASRALRVLEARLMRRTALLVTSSPGFLRAYFENPVYARPRLPAMVIENKLLELEPGPGPRQGAMAPGPPWIVGWFGNLRCRRSLEILARLARARPDLVRVRIYGRAADPVRNALGELSRTIGGLEFGGAYEAQDLPRLYSQVHFNWAIDYFEENANSEWLLPNRIYEGGSTGAVALALARTETGRWLAERGLGVRFDEPQSELEAFFATLSPARFAALKQAADTAPRSLFVADRADCRAFAGALTKVAREGRAHAAPAKLAKAAA